MSKFHGLLLFDIADKPIGQWKENLGYRGMIDVWETKTESIVIETVEDCECHEVWWHDKEGNSDTLAILDSYDEAIKYAKSQMRDHPKGLKHPG